MLDETLERQIFKLKADDREKVRRLLWLIEQDAKDLTPSQLREVRINSGLSVGQAAKMMGVQPETVLAAESDTAARVLPELAELMNAAYHINQKEERSRG